MTQTMNHPDISETGLARRILADDLLLRVHDAAMELLRSGLSAGTRYPEVWIRDLATFLELSCRAGAAGEVRTALLMFFDFQQPDGAIIDGFTARQESVDPYNYILCAKYPEMVGHKNTVETDQESSLVIGARNYIEASGDTGLLAHVVDGVTVLDRLERAVNWVLQHRWSDRHGLAWNATTIDWGDMQPEHAWGVKLDENSHPALCIYTNALFSVALRDLIWLQENGGRRPDTLREKRTALDAAIRKHLWDVAKAKFRPHVYLERGSPFPEDFDEDAIYYHGGTATAMLAGVLTPDEAVSSFRQMQKNVADAGAQTVGLSVWPLYNCPSLPNKLYAEPFAYQNGGDWPWWGGRVSLGLFASGCPGEAYEALRPIADMIEKQGGFYEWHRPDGTPHGSGFRGSAGVVGKAISALRDWAAAQEKSS
jgi:hypothetical protein